MSDEHLDLAQVVEAALQAQGVAPVAGLVEVIDSTSPPVLRVFGGPRTPGVVEPFLDCSIYGNGAARLTYGGTGAPKLDEAAFAARGAILKVVQGAVIAKGPYAPLPVGPAD